MSVTKDDRQPFTLVGGPLDGEVVVVGRCMHGDWPDLASPGGGLYRLVEETYLYKWQADDAS